LLQQHFQDEDQHGSSPLQEAALVMITLPARAKPPHEGYSEI
jgi:hypothetical protein